MNYRRGLWRLWVFSFPIWWVYCFLEVSYVGCRMFAATIERANRCEYRTNEFAFILALVVPLVVLVLGRFVVWVIDGFQKDRG